MNTALLYILTESVSIFFLKLSEIVKKNETSPRHINNPNSRMTKYIFIFFSFIPLLLLLGFRGISVGVDTYRYSNVFYRIVTDTLSRSDQDWLGNGFIILGKIVNFLFGNNFVALNFIVAFFTLFFIYGAILKLSENPSLSLFLFFSFCLFYQSMNQSRQMLSISIIFYSFTYLIDRKIIGYMLLVLLAASIHNSAVIMIPFYFIANLKINKKIIAIYIISALLILLFSNRIIQLIASTSYGVIYSSTDYFQSSSSSFFNLFVRIVMLIGILIFYKKLINTSERYSLLINLIIWCTLFQIITLQVYIFARITTYFFVAYILLIPAVISLFKFNYKTKFIASLVVILGFSLYHYIYYVNTAVDSGYNNYYSIFER
ncbi:EpsG family protein [Streptococcus suis]|nr:EpsG family protein [Streptococcus suis]